MYAFFLLDENVRPRKSRDKPIKAFFASSLGYVFVSMMAPPIDSNWSVIEKREQLIECQPRCDDQTHLLMVTWSYRNVLRLHPNRPSAVDPMMCKTYYAIASHSPPHCCPKMKNAHSVRERRGKETILLYLSICRWRWTQAAWLTVWLFSKNCISSSLTNFRTQL